MSEYPTGLIAAINQETVDLAKHLRENPGERKAQRHFEPPSIPNVGEGQVFFPHQAQAFQEMARRDRGQDQIGLDAFALDVDMGGGKLRLFVYEALRCIEQGLSRRPLIVMPKHTLAQQKDEILKFANPTVNIVIITGGAEGGTVGSYVSGDKSLKVQEEWEDEDGKTRRSSSRPKWTSEALMEVVATAPPNTLFFTSYSYLTAARKGANLQIDEETGAPTKFVVTFDPAKSPFGSLAECKRKFPGFPFDDFDEMWPFMQSHPIFCAWLEENLGTESGTFWSGADHSDRVTQFDELLMSCVNDGKNNPWTIGKRQAIDFLKAGIDMVSLDESHWIKNPDSERAKAIAQLDHPQVAVRRIGSGTFMPHDPRDLLNQLNWLMPLRDSTGAVIGNKVFGSVQRFNQTFCEEIDVGRGQTKFVYKTTKVTVRVEDPDTGELTNKWVPALKAIRMMLSSRVPAFDENGNHMEDSSGAPVMVGPIGISLRREAWGFLLPEKQETVHHVRMNKLQQSLYNRLYLQAIDGILQDPSMRKAWEKFQAEGESGSLPTRILAKVQVLEQFISAPDSDGLADAIHDLLQDQSGMSEDLKQFIRNLQDSMSGRAVAAEDAIVSAKVKVMDELIEKHLQKKEMLPRLDRSGEEVIDEDTGEVVMSSQQGKVIVFCNHIPVAEHLKKHSKFGRYGAVYHASDAARKNLDRFKTNPKVKVLFAVKDSITEGHNLQHANCVIVVSTPWSTGTLDQMLARVYRPKQRFRVFVHHIIADKTLEPVKFARLIAKRSDIMQINSDYGDEIDPVTGHRVEIPEVPLPAFNDDTISELGEPSAFAVYENCYQAMLRFETARARKMRPIFGEDMYDLDGGTVVEGFPIVVPAVKPYKGSSNVDTFRGGSWSWVNGELVAEDDAVDITGQIQDFDWEEHAPGYYPDGTPEHWGEEAMSSDPSSWAWELRSINPAMVGEPVLYEWPNVAAGTHLPGEVIKVLPSVKDEETEEMIPQVVLGLRGMVHRDDSPSRSLTYLTKISEQVTTLTTDPKLIFPRTRSVPIGTMVHVRPGAPGVGKWMEDHLNEWTFTIVGVDYEVFPFNWRTNSNDNTVTIEYTAITHIPVLYDEIEGVRTPRPMGGTSPATDGDENSRLIKLTSLDRKHFSLAEVELDDFPMSWIREEHVNAEHVRHMEDFYAEDQKIAQEIEDQAESKRKEKMLGLWDGTFGQSGIQGFGGGYVGRTQLDIKDIRLFVDAQKNNQIEVGRFQIKQLGVSPRLRGGEGKKVSARRFDYYSATDPTSRSVMVRKTNRLGTSKQLKLNMPHVFPGAIAQVLAFQNKSDISHAVLLPGSLQMPDGSVVKGMEVWILTEHARVAKHKAFVQGLTLQAAREASGSGNTPWQGFKAVARGNESLDFGIAG